MSKWWFNIVILLVLVCISRPVLAQDLRLNTPIEGNISAGNAALFAFVAREGQILSMLVRSRDALDPVLTILDRNGAPLLSNDDYNYPESRDALIEGFTAPYTGSYTLSISGYGDTSGNFDLLMLPGYSQLSYQDTFEGATSWRLAMLRAEPLPTLGIQQGELRLTQSGIRQNAVAYGPAPSATPYYYTVQVARIDSSQGWQVGIIFHYRNENLHYRYLINNSGAWGVELVAGGQRQMLRNWSTHPAILAGSTSFTLSVLVNAGTFEFFYDEQFIGSINDRSLSEGQIGVTASTVDAIGSNVEVSYRSLLVTTPAQINGTTLIPDQLVGGGTNYSIRELERRQVIPGGGTMALTVDSSFFQNVSAGVTRYPIGSGIRPRNFAIGASITWEQSGNALQGCGLMLREDSDTQRYILAFVDSTTGYGLAERNGETFVTSIYNDTIPINPKPYRMLVIANNNTISLYMNNQYAGSIETELGAGNVAEAIVNYNAVNTLCTFNNLWIWQWD